MPHRAYSSREIDRCDRRVLYFYRLPPRKCSPSFKEVCQLTRVPKKIIGQCFKVIEHAFSLTARPSTASAAGTPNASGNTDGTGGGASTGSSPEDLLARYCNHLDLHPSVQGVCRDVVLLAREHSVAQGRSLVSIAGGAILFTNHQTTLPPSACLAKPSRSGYGRSS